MLLQVASGEQRSLTGSLDRVVTSYAFAPDATSITFIVEDDGDAYVARVDLRTGAITPVTRGAFVASSLSTAGGHSAVVYSDATAPREIYALDGGTLRKLSAHNDALLGELKLGSVQDLRFKSSDGTDVHGFAVMPPNHVPGRRYPAILWIHGGPDAQDVHALGTTEIQRQLLAAAGYVVVAVNYRGSSGRGSRYARTIFADWGHKEVADLLAAMDHVVGTGIADPKRLGIGGLELRCHIDRLHDRHRWALQGCVQRRRQRQSTVDVRRRRIYSAI